MKDIKKGENTSLTKNGSVAKAEVKKTVKAEGKTAKNGTKNLQSKKNVKKDRFLLQKNNIFKFFFEMKIKKNGFQKLR